MCTAAVSFVAVKPPSQTVSPGPFSLVLLRGSDKRFQQTLGTMMSVVQQDLKRDSKALIHYQDSFTK